MQSRDLIEADVPKIKRKLRELFGYEISVSKPNEWGSVNIISPNPPRQLREALKSFIPTSIRHQEEGSSYFIMGVNSKEYRITSDGWASIQALATPHDAALAMRYLYSKNCRAVVGSGLADRDRITFVFDKDKDATDVKSALSEEHKSEEHKAENKQEIWSGFQNADILQQRPESKGKPAFQLSRLQQQEVVNSAKKIAQDRKEKFSKWIISDEFKDNNVVSRRTQKYLHSQVQLIEQKEKEGTLSMADLYTFESAVKKLPMPREYYHALMAFLAATAFILVTAATAPVGAAAYALLIIPFGLFKLKQGRDRTAVQQREEKIIAETVFPVVTAAGP